MNRKAALLTQNSNIQERLIYDYDSDELHLLKCNFFFSIIEN